MSDDDAYPDFGSAYPLPVPGLASAPASAPGEHEGASHWHPAKRPNSDARHERTISTASELEFYDRFPQPTPEKPRPRARAEPMEDVQEDGGEGGLRAESPVRRHSITVQTNIRQTSDPATPEQMSQLRSYEGDAEGPMSRRASGQEPEEVLDSDDEPLTVIDQIDAENPTDQHEHPASAQELQPGTSMPVSSHHPIFIGTPGMQTPIATDLNFETELGKFQQSQHEAAMEYEHQGEVTELEEAVDEAPNAPLLDDPEAPPTVQDEKQEATMEVVEGDSVLDDLDGSSAPGQPLPKSSAHLGHIDRSFTTNFTEVPKAVAREESQEEQAPIDADWPSAGDDRTFGDLLDDEHSTPAQQTSADPVPDVDPVSKPSFDAWGSTANEDAFDFLGEQEGTANSANKQPKGHRRQDTWGGIGSDDTFGELVGATQSTIDESSSSAAVPVAEAETAAPIQAPVTAPAEQLDDDMAAAFAAALDDDDLLDEGAALDPSAFFGDDDPGFLDDELLPDPTPASSQTTAQKTPNQLQRTASPYVPQTAQQPVQQPSQSNAYAVAPLQLSQSHGRSAGTPMTGLYDVYNQGAPVQQPQPPQRPSAQSAQSFVDKAKGGYQSPYDLPMDVVKQPRQRPRQAPSASQAAPTPPPRSSSMSSDMAHPTLARPPTAGSQGINLTPPSSSGSMPAPAPNNTMGIPPAAKPTPKPSNPSGFFEDLPMAPKPRARPSGAYTPQPQAGAIPPGAQQQLPPRGPVPPAQQPQRPSAPPAPAQQHSYGGLTQPERLPLLPEQPTAPTHPQAPSVPNVNQRYSPSSLPAPAQNQNRFSPAPPGSQAPPAAGARYSPAPAAQAAAKKYSPASAAQPATNHAMHHSQSHAFAPRTSSPLAYHDKPHAAMPNELTRNAPSLPSSPPRVNGGRASPAIMSPERAGSLSYSPIDQRDPAASITSPPQRPQTVSPPAVMKTSKYSAQVPLEQLQTAGTQMAPVSSGQGALRSSFLPHRRQFSRDLNYVPPTDQHAQDNLQRWKGQPIFHWEDSGAVVSSLPKQTPFYAAGHGLPSIKCTPGAINVEQATVFMPMDDINAKFPGPLPIKSKKKKDVLSWMSTKIEALEQQVQNARMDFQMESDLKKRSEEKLTLWKIMRIFVEHDGKLEGDKKIEDELRVVLLPNLAQMSQVTELQSPIAAGAIQADTVDNAVIIQLRQALLEGQRERAVWLAEEKKMWGHAMLIASTLGPETWKQVIQSFVRSQVKTVGSDARSLAALYQVFAGNAEECVDELVPPSAREGRQMVSKTGSAIATNPLEGLDQWQETLGLIAGNRTSTDVHSLLAMGKLLAGYDRAEAAHSCFLFARQLAKHTGGDDPEAAFVLLGANTRDLGHDLDAIILTEIYEWASSLSMQRPEYIAHLQSWKLMHAQQLAASGINSKASHYCDHITSAYQSTTKPSPYYHPTFTQAVADLSAFLSQTPQTDGKGLLSKGAMKNVTSKTSSWFTKFVSGDDDQDSNASGGGPGNEVFGMVNGESSDISRRASGDGLYGAMMGGSAMPAYGQPPVTTPFQQTPAPPSSQSKYAPSAGSANGGKYAPMASGTMASGTMAMPGSEAQRAVSERRYAPVLSRQPSVAGNLDAARPGSSRAVSDYGVPYTSDSRRGSAQFSTGSYEPRPLLAEQPKAHTNQAISYQLAESHDTQNFNGPTPALGGNSDSPAHENAADVEDAGPTESYNPPPNIGYEPPSHGYEPPSYQPYEPEPDMDDVQDKPRRKMMDDDDDDDIMARASAIKASTPAANSSGNQSSSLSKSEADRIAEEVFRKAAEADAARDKAPKEGKKGWFGGVGLGGGGWFGGKKDAAMPQAASNKPIKAKLGEENSFYFDKELGKWVNKKDPQSAQTAAAATPPPPRAGPSRVTSAAMGSPSGPPSRVGSGIGFASTPGPSSISGSPQLAQGPPSGPPSRIGTPAVGSDSGTLAMGMNPAIAALNGSAPPSKPPSRPATSMSNASSLDDLLGEPTARKAGGTVKSKKKGGRYVDVMQAK